MRDAPVARLFFYAFSYTENFIIVVLAWTTPWHFRCAFFCAMRDLIAEEILRKEIQRDRMPSQSAGHRLEFPSSRQPRPRPQPARIPPANRYPHSVVRDELERQRSPWNRVML
jgi:hypothetical protein